MFYFNSEAELDNNILNKMINSFYMDVKPKLLKYKNYYDGVQAILRKNYSDSSKPCNRTVINYCKDIVDSYAGYMATPGYITYTSDNDISEIQNILKYNDYQTEDADFLLNALIYGVSAELMYIDRDGHTRFNLIDPTTCFGVYDDSLNADLLYFVRIYKENDWNDSNIYNVDVYSDKSIKKYKMSGEDGYLTFSEEIPHYFSQCPANIFALPDEKSIFECIMSLQDAINEIFSGEIDDFTSFCDAYLVITGADLEVEDLIEMRKNRGLNLPEGASADWLTKNINDTQVENLLKRAQDSIYKIAHCPDFSSESFVGGVSSGIAIRYRLTGMETKCGTIEGRMRKALQRRIEIICGIASLKYGEEIFRDIRISFRRNVPEDLDTTIKTINGLQGIVSNKTLISQLPFVNDVDAELEAVKKQKEENMEVFNFGKDEEKWTTGEEEA